MMRQRLSPTECSLCLCPEKRNSYFQINLRKVKSHQFNIATGCGLFRTQASPLVRVPALRRGGRKNETSYHCHVECAR